MNLLFKWVGSGNWQKSNLEKEEEYIRAFWDIEEAKKILREKKILPCSIKLFRLFDGVV